jgi:DNA-binding transcriptional LysR family regulator
MRPTPRAEELSGGIAQALQLLADHLGDATRFDPRTWDQTITFAATDFTTFVNLPAVIARLEQAAPAMRVRVLPSRSANALDDLSAGAQFVLGFADEFVAPAGGVERTVGTAGDYVAAARRGHPCVRGA